MTQPPPTHRAREEEWSRKPPSILRSLVILAALALLATSFIYLASGNLQRGIIMLALALTPLLYSAQRTTKRRQLERAAHAASSNHCPHCDYDLQGLEHPDRCPECGESVDLLSIEREWSKVHAHEPDDPESWTRLSLADMPLPSWLRATGVLTLAAASTTLISWILLNWQTVGTISGSIFLVTAPAHGIGTLLHARRSWDYLKSMDFLICPRCKRDLRSTQHAADADSKAPHLAHCPRCGIGYTPPWLKRTWSFIYGQ